MSVKIQKLKKECFSPLSGFTLVVSVQLPGSDSHMGRILLVEKVNMNYHSLFIIFFSILCTECRLYFTNDLSTCSIYLKELLELGVENGKAEIHPRKYSIVASDQTFSGEIQVGITFTPKVFVWDFFNAKWTTSIHIWKQLHGIVVTGTYQISGHLLLHWRNCFIIKFDGTQKLLYLILREGKKIVLADII